MERVIQTTADGSTTIYLPEIDEHYHSVKGALTESEHIYINSALAVHPDTKLRVLEIGFGTGLNAFLSAIYPKKDIEYFTLELYPLSTELIEKTGYANLFSEEGKNTFYALHHAEWNKEVTINPHFHITKILDDFTNPGIELPKDIDVVYFDAFAPEKQPQMWSQECLQRIYDIMAPHSIFITYCAKGEIRRRLQSLGFTTQRIPGPPNGKREILRAIK